MPPPAEVAIGAERPQPVGALDVGTLLGELGELRERHLRLVADFQNYRRRTEQEIVRRADSEVDRFICELLAVVDSLERGVAVSAPDACESYRCGMRMVLDQAVALLRQHGLEPRDDQGRPFDPHWHEAVVAEPRLSLPPGTVLAVWRRGWSRGGRPFRSAQVVVSVAVGEDAEAPMACTLAGGTRLVHDAARARPSEKEREP